jgi:DNA polymerase-3 subunit alpha
MNKIPFCHLHLHTEYNLYGSTCKLAGIMAQAHATGQKYVAMTNNGALYGVLEFYALALAAGIKPIIGCEMLIAEPDEASSLVLLAETQQGHQNLVHLVSLNQLPDGDGFAGPVDKNILRQYSEGLIGLSAGFNGAISKACLKGNVERAVALSREYAEIFGAGNFFLEIQDYGLPEHKDANRCLLEAAKTARLPLVATNDVHYLSRTDHLAHILLSCMRNTEQAACRSDEFYMKSGEEMRELFPDLPEALANTVKIAQRCTVDLSGRIEHAFPEFTLPPGADSKLEYLVQLGREGLQKRYTGRVSAEAFEKASEQLHYELSMTQRAGCVDYFLIVQDIVCWAKAQGIAVGPGRGKEAGSILAYALGITATDPLLYGLRYERFEQPNRFLQPDFDLEFCHERRGEVIEYLRNKYGSDCVGQIVTFKRFTTRTLYRDTGIELGIPETDCVQLTKLIPAGSLNLSDARLKSPEFDKACEKKNSIARHILKYATVLEGLPYAIDRHAAALVIGGRPLAGMVPVAKTQNSDMPVVQFEKGALERCGLMTIDILSLRASTATSFLMTNTTGK